VHGAGQHVAVGGPYLDVAHDKLSRVHHHHVDRFVDHGIDRERSGERGRGHVGLDLEVIGLRLDRAGQAIRLCAIPASRHGGA
jgi:hypothetical protein